MGVVVNHSIQTQLTDSDSGTVKDITYSWTDTGTNIDVFTQKLKLETTGVTLFTDGARAAGATFTNIVSVFFKNLSATETIFINFVVTGSSVAGITIAPGKVAVISGATIYGHAAGTTSVSAAAYADMSSIFAGASGDCLCEYTVYATRG